MNRLRSRLLCNDAGFTLVEMLVGMVLFSLVMSSMITAVLTATKATNTTKQIEDANEEARLALVRISRELRQAKSLDAATLFMTGPEAINGWASSITFSVDFNGNGTIEPDAVDPEVLTYRFVPDASGAGNGQIELTANDAAGTSVVRPILSAHVSAFHIELRSSQWSCDTSGDGTATWQELDTNTNATCRHPDNNGILDNNELQQIDSVKLVFTVFEGAHKQDYRSQINLRNVGVSSSS